MSSTAVATLQPRLSITASVARQYGMEPGPFEQTLRRTVVPAACTREEFAAFLLVAKNYGLNPILREIYAFPKKGGGIQPIVGVDGWSTMINRHEQFDGMSFEDHFDKDGKLVAITCRMHRKDRAHPIEATEYLEECLRKEASGKVSDVWAKWPRRMLRHKAMIQAARYAFGFSGVIDPDEYDRFGASPHDPAMLQAQMQIENGTADVDMDDTAPQATAGEEDQRPIEEVQDATYTETGDEIDSDTGEITPRDPVAERRMELLAEGNRRALHGERKLGLWYGGLSKDDQALVSEQDLASMKQRAAQQEG